MRRRPFTPLQGLALAAGAAAVAGAALLPADRIISAVLTPEVAGYVGGKRGAAAVEEYRILLLAACRWLRWALLGWGGFMIVSAVAAALLPALPSREDPAQRGGWGRRDLWLFLPVAVAAVLGALAVREAFTIDEVATLIANVRRGPLITAAHIVSAPHRTHTAYALSEWASCRVLGETALGVRLPALLFGMANVVLLYWVGRRFLTRSVGWVAALALALSAAHVQYSATARGYTLLALATLAQASAGLALLERESRARWLAFILSGVMAGYAQLYGILLGALIAGTVAAAAWMTRPRPADPLPLTARLAWAGGFVLATLFLLYATGIPRQLETAGYLGNTLAYYPFRPRMGAPFLARLGSEFSLAPGVAGVVAIQWGLAAVGVVVAARRFPRAAMVLGLPSLAFLLAMTVSGKEVQTRYFFAALPAASVFLAIGLMAVMRDGARTGAGSRWLRPAVAGLLLAAAALPALAAFYPAERNGLREAVAIARALRQPGERVAALTDSAQTAAYYWGEVERVERPDDLRRILRNPPEWVVYAGEAYLKVDAPEVFKMLQERYVCVARVPARDPQEDSARVWRRKRSSPGESRNGG